MCGIIGYVGSEQAVPLLLEGLKRLEYRGYDSAGIAVLESDRILRFRRAGKVKELEADLNPESPAATIGIGHTRWATHGPPTEANAHPHFDCHGRIAVIHNGIIENYMPLRERLMEEGHRFSSETDTEVLAHLMESEADGDLLTAIRAVVSQAEGAFALAVISLDAPNRVFVARRGSPLVLGSGPTGTFACSDIPALLGRATDVQFLGDDEVAELSRDSIRVYDIAGRPIERPSHKVSVDPVSIQKGGYKHFMLKEIHEQARAVGETIREKIDQKDISIDLDGLGDAASSFDHVYLVACGTAYHASLTAEYLWEKFLPVPIQAVIASEFRIRQPHITDKTLVVAVSQSGETIDTLMAVRRAREKNAHIVAVVNSEHSAIDREADASVYTRAGIEIGVAATKTFTAQIAALGLLGLELARRKTGEAEELIASELSHLSLLPGRITETLQAEPEIHRLAEKLHHATDVLFLARGALFPIALEGALKLKEISYIHAEAYPAGEMKHGPIALIDDGTPVVFLLSRGIAYEKVLANMEEVKARNGHLIVVTDAPDEPALARVADTVLAVPEIEGISRPILFTLPLQLLAYHTAVWRGTDVDQPRNLAKTVTVE
ncbi:MAG: glutamine--fructose-6-phosphate transaminase (isomerizing) [Candidatus Bipolaricaulia bacterium]